MAHSLVSFSAGRKALLLVCLSVAWLNGAFAQSNSTGQLRDQISKYVEQQGKVKWLSQAVISADGKFVAWGADGDPGNSTHAIYFAPVASPKQAKRITAAAPGEWAYEMEPQWSHDGKRIAFLSDAHDGQNQIFIADITGSDIKVKQAGKFDGYISHLKWSPDDKHLSVLYVEKASREPSPMAAGNRRVGVIDSLTNTDVQRIATVDAASGDMVQATPAGLYVFEYSWSADSKMFAYTAAVPPGDDNWYIAKLYRQSLGGQDTVMVYKPKLQIAVPRWSPDGKQLAFIEGLMSDQGGTGGEIFTVSAQGGAVRNLTPGRKSSPSWFTWRPDGNLLFTEFTGGSVAISTLNTQTLATQTLWKGDETIQATSDVTSISVAETKGTPQIAFIRNAYARLPEVWAGTTKKLTQITTQTYSAELPLPKSENIEWTNENLQLQGWLLYPANYDKTKRYPMLVMVHGGPAWIATPTWSAPDFNTTLYTNMGYFVFFPNARGSHGRGEQFTQANRRDWGFGDLRDILSGVEAVMAKHPVDGDKLGLLGWSYGGSMAMFAPTQTNRFKAVVAGAGAGDWLSYYGQNAIDKWMMSYFGKSAYEDPAAYAKVSAMTYITKAKTPALILVGERDGESPAPQSFQYWHALKDLGVPTQLVVYADEGHSFNKPENLIDITLRTIQWFNKYLK
ncbi:S9 family peptidase [Mucilaginibacter conchicola]|uniref:S9 family peptidase n=1 Tax=Mucilaginibacter conchicola TaxID=2303333 RepID=A0A372NV31_9SPHI|nr:S9 family peptidase [Mucilaginibacter conchicola]RFZ94000.1 S9 family peptidase [Mucilaginibacter conchicola]